MLLYTQVDYQPLLSLMVKATKGCFCFILIVVDNTKCFFIKWVLLLPTCCHPTSFSITLLVFFLFSIYNKHYQRPSLFALETFACCLFLIAGELIIMKWIMWRIVFLVKG